MFGQIGGLNAVGAPLPNNQIGGESFIRHVGNDKLIYDFHEGSGTTVHDKSHCGNNGTLGAGAAAPTWKRNSLYFDGENDYIDLTGINHGISTGEFTFYFSFSNLPSMMYFFDQKTIRTVITSNGNKINFYIDCTQLLTPAGIDSIIPLDIQITRDKLGNLECYLNGVSQNQGTSNINSMAYNGKATIRLGSSYLGAHFLITTMYSFCILDKGLSGIECQQEYLSQKFRGNN